MADLRNEQSSFKAVGKIEAIEVEIGKTGKTGYTYNAGVITVSIKGVKQKIRLMGGIGANEFKLNVFKKGADGKAVKDENGKTIRLSIDAKDYSEEEHLNFNKIEVITWNNNEKNVLFMGANEGRFLAQLKDKIGLLLNKKVKLTGECEFKTDMNVEKLEANMKIRQITIYDETEDGKELNEYFLIETPVIVDKSSVDEITEENGISVFVPMYHKYVVPQEKNGTKIAGRRIFTPFHLNINKNGFMALSSESGFDVEDRRTILSNKIKALSEGTELAIAKVVLSYKSGYTQREIDFDDLIQDEVYKIFAEKALAVEDEQARKIAMNDVVEMYRATNPVTVKGEFKQNVEFISLQQDKTGDMVSSIDRDLFEFCSFETIKNDTEQMKGNVQPAKQTQTQAKVEVKTPTVENTVPAPPIPNNFMEDDEFPF